MQARRTATSSPALPSSPPTAFQQEGAASPSTEALGVSSPAQTLWTAASPTQTLGHSSPELPPLPSLASLGGVPRTPSTVARHQATDTTYYTASWGSPYQRPPPGFNINSGLRDPTAFDSDDLEEDASNLQFGLEHLLPSPLNEEHSSDPQFGLEHLLPSRLTEGDSPNRFGLEHLLPSRLLVNQAITPTRSSFSPISGAPEVTPRPSGISFADTLPQQLLNDSTGDWVRQFLGTNWDNEKVNWWSDESSNNESSIQKDGKQVDSVEGQVKQKKKGHRSRKSNLTLKQQDFWAHFSEEQKETFGKMMASKYADPTHSRKGSATSQLSQPLRSPASEKPLPPPSANNDAPAPLPELPREISSARAKEEPIQPPPAPRPRKRVPWKGKACWIGLPPDIPRGTPGYPPKLLRSPEVAARLEAFERAGYGVSGFDHLEKGETLSGASGLAQSRSVYPGPGDIVEERGAERLRVRIPVEAEWKAYEDYLTEQKLAALGVSLGGEEDVPPAMSRKASSQYPALPFSPPLPTSSAGSQRLGHPGSVISGTFPRGPSPGHTSTRSIASPISPFGNQRPGMHMHRHSTFTSPANFQHQQPTPPGLPGWSPQQYFGPQGLARGGSPALSHNRPDFGDTGSPASPYGFRPNQQFPLPQKDDLLIQMQQQQQQLQTQLLLQQQQQLLSIRPSSTLAEVPEDEDEEDEVADMKQAGLPDPQIAVPTPRGHQHNISANLERDIRDAENAEYHLEQAIDKQLEEGGEFSTESPFNSNARKDQINAPNSQASKSSWEEPRPVQQVLHQPQPHSRAHSLTKPQRPLSMSFNSQGMDSQREELSDSARTNASEATNPSLKEGEVLDSAPSSRQHSKNPSQASTAWKDSRFAFGRSGSIHSKHTSTSSVSKLNVEAKEFKFNPSASFSPSTSAFSPSSSSVGFSFQPAASKPITSDSQTAQRSNNASIDGLGSGLNVTAPAFKPSFGSPGSAFPSSNFDFLSKGPTFKPDVPAFSPLIASPAVVQTPTVPVEANGPSKIFGNLNMNANDFVKPANRSKAVPIIRPDNTQQVEEAEDKEDELGRITQADGREKRARRGRAVGDQVPQFAMPSHPLSEASQNQAPKQDPETGRTAVPENKENLSPNVEQSQAKSKSPQPLSGGTPLREDASFGPSKHTPKTDDVSDSPSDAKTPTEAEPGRDLEATPSVEDQPKLFTKKHASKGSLSATAKPFEYRPQIGSGFDFGIHVQKPSAIKSDERDIPQISPPRHVSRSPATTFRPSDDGSYQTAPEPRKHTAPYPDGESIDYDYVPDTFDDIDSVLKHFNEEGSDFGVERDDHLWAQSSPRRSIHGFERLQPNTQLRSDAPSPSPRRIYALAPGAMNASSTSITHDPFSDERAGLAYESPVHRLNNAEEVPVSDWDEGISSEGEDKIQTRSRFFDSHVDGLIGRLLHDRLGPLERNLALIQNSIATMSQKGGRGRRSMSTNERLDSDADDEDDEAEAEFHYRNRSPRKDRKLEKIRATVLEALASQQSQQRAQPATVPMQPPLDLTELHQALGDIKASITSVSPQPAVDLSALHHALGDIKTSIASVPSQPAVDLSELNRALDEIKTSVASAPAQPAVDLSEFYQALGDMKASIAQSAAVSVQPEDFREMVEDALKRQSTDIVVRRESQNTEENEARITDLQSLIKEATLQLESEIEARKVVEAREVDTQRLLKITEEELALLQNAARDDENKLRVMDEERHDARAKIAALRDAEEDLRAQLASLANEMEDSKLKAVAYESSEEDLTRKMTGLMAENEALQFTLEEYRMSSDKWRQEVQQANAEKEQMKKAVDATRFQAEEATRIRETMRSKLDKLQQDMSVASGQVSAERAQWQKSEKEHMTRYEVLSARIEAEGRTRERLERELERLEGQEREGMRLKVTLEQTQKANARLEDAVNALRHQSDQHQRAAEKYERDYHEAREAGRVEVQRTRVLMEADIDVANNQVNMVRAEMDNEISRLRAEMDNVRMDVDTAKARNELLLEEAADSKQQALDEAMHARKAAMQEQERTFERRVELLQQEHSRALEMAVEDKDRSESYLKERLSLSNAKLEHLQDKIAHLEEKVSVAQSAAQAAAQAAQSAKAPSALASHHGNTTGQPERISPQALRESIAVLQEQLQERESRIESLEHKLSEVDTEAPAKLNQRDTEIGWLRELLGVRIDDLSDLINALAQPAFSREAVRDAAIRIRTNLQMEQQEKERLITGGGQNVPTIVNSLSNFASPKAVQLAAAFGNWRKGRDTAASSLSSASASTSRTQTPSRSAPPRAAPVPSTQSFLSGLMTPPTSNLRRTPQALSAVRPQPYSRSNSSSSTFRGSDAGFAVLGKQAVAGAEQRVPSTPPLLRGTNYDEDAEDGHYSENGYYDEDSTVDGNPDDRPGFEGFGPGLHR